MLVPIFKPGFDFASELFGVLLQLVNLVSYLFVVFLHGPFYFSSGGADQHLYLFVEIFPGS